MDYAFSANARNWTSVAMVVFLAVAILLSVGVVETVEAASRYGNDGTVYYAREYRGWGKLSGIYIRQDYTAKVEADGKTSDGKNAYKLKIKTKENDVIVALVGESYYVADSILPDSYIGMTINDSSYKYYHRIEVLSPDTIRVHYAGWHFPAVIVGGLQAKKNENIVTFSEKINVSNMRMK